jgi:hypothetical protein
LRTAGIGQKAGVPVWAVLEVGLVFAQSSGDDRLLSQLLGANAGALFVLFAYTRRLRAARAGRKLEHHVMYRSAPFLYAAGWLLPIAFAVALLRRDDPSLAAFALSASFVVLWVLSGIVLRRDWHLEHRVLSHRARP